jgi:hypothetical protein
LARVPRAEAASATSGVADFARAVASGVLGFLSWFFLGGSDLIELGSSYRRRARFWIVARVGAALGLGVVAYTAMQSTAALLAMAGLAVLSVLWFVRRRRARAALFDAASRPLDAAGAPAGALPSRLFPWYALRVLATAIDAARHGNVEATNRALDDLDVDALSPEERRFEDASRALSARRWGDRREAVRRALAAFPTGALALDEELARITIEDAWHDANRLASLASAWDAHDVWPADSTAIGRFRYLIDLKLKRADGAGLEPAVASSLAEEARALGDAELVLVLSAPPESRDYRS